MRELKGKYFCIVDIELTEEKEIIQFAAKKIDFNFRVINSINYYIKPIQSDITSFVTDLTGITNEILRDKPSFREVSKVLYEYIKDGILVCHGLQSDYLILKKHFQDIGIEYSPSMSLDTVELARLFLPTQSSYRLSDLAASLNIYSSDNYHNAVIDVKATAKLLETIALKIPLIQKENYNNIYKLLKKIDSNIALFFEYYKNNTLTSNIIYNNGDYIVYDGVKFKKLGLVNKENETKCKILFSSIDVNDYISKFNVIDYTVLKKKSDYVSLDIFSLLSKKNDLNLYKLLVKLYIWILETTNGDLSELNLLYLERLYLEECREALELSSNSYYFDEKKQLAKGASNVIVNYDNLEYILNNDEFSNYTLIFENKKILGNELDSNNIKEYRYKSVITELNIAISQNPSDKKLKVIKENLDSLIKFLHEMYISESLVLYNESLEYILQDIAVLQDSLKNIKRYLPITRDFCKQLTNALLNKKNSYTFDILYQESTLVLLVIDDKKVKTLINTINRRDYQYLDMPNKVSLIYIKDEKELMSSKFSGSVLYVFESTKYKNLYFSKRERKTYVKYINFSLKDSFAQLYTDVIKNNKVICRCYATRDILNYKYYLKNLFDTIVILKDLEY